jgi:glycosyltransferase involved in cell wall biosynthesis
MRILQINTVANSGSTGRIAEEIGNIFIKNGHESYIAFGRGNRPSNSNLIKIGTQKDIYQHGLATLLFDKHGLASKNATKKFIRRIEEIKPDAIGLHNIHGYYLNYPVLFKFIKEKNIPVVWTFHDCWPFTGHCSYFESVGCEKWKTHCEKCPLTGNYPKALMDRSYQNFEDKQNAFSGVQDLKIITPSTWLAGLAKQSFLTSYPVEVIHNGVDLKTFKPKAKEIKDDDHIILGVASTWDARKGLQDFIELRKILALDSKIVLIGLSDKQIEQLPKGIQGIKRTENVEALVDWYNKASVFVNPTYVDNFPTTNLEALACGTPVVTYNTGGSPEAIDHQTGIVVDKGDVKALSEAVLTMVKNEATVKACRERAEKYFNKEDRYKEYLSIYNQLITQN